MAKIIASVIILSVIYAVALAKPGVHTIRIRFPGANSDKLIFPKPVKQENAPYPAAGFRPEPPFELPQPTYLPPAEPKLTYGPPHDTYGPPNEPESSYEPPEPELSYGPPPSDTYGPPAFINGSPDNIYEPAEINGFPSAAIVNAPLTHATQFTPPRPNKAIHFRPLHQQSAAIVNSPLKPTSQLIAARPQRPIRPQLQSQQLYPKTYLTLPRVERVIEFRPRPIKQKPHANFLSRPLPASIFGNSNNRKSGRQLPSNIFPN